VNPGQPVRPLRAVVQLHPDTVERLAARTAVLVTERLERSQPTEQQRPGMLTATEVSEWWGLHRGWVYQHAKELGAIPIGTGQRPRLRFDPEQVARRLARPPRHSAQRS
jgi:hypothetical protein